VHWGYDGETGPDHWASLSPDFRLCRYGMNQSPIDIGKTFDVDLGPLSFDYSTRATSVVNNGHTFQVDIEPGSFMRVEGDQFELDQIHFHSPSEHRVQGESFPLEAHLVHQNGVGELAVVGVLFRLGEEHRDLTKLGALASPKVGESSPVDFDLGILMALHESHEAYFRYSGSLTTPPCSEGVRWFILKKISHILATTGRQVCENHWRGRTRPQPQRARIVLEH